MIQLNERQLAHNAPQTPTGFYLLYRRVYKEFYAAKPRISECPELAEQRPLYNLTLSIMETVDFQLQTSLR